MATRSKPAPESLPAPTRPGIYARGSETVDTILNAALQVLIEDGASAFTLRRIAQQCGLSVGNVSRHFPRKEMLVQVLLEEVLSPSEGLIERNIRSTGMSAEDALGLVITGSLDQISTRSMTLLFIELWAIGNHNEFVADRLEASYRYVQTMIGSFVKQLNPALNDEEVDVVALFISASIEGATPLAGHGKPWSEQMPQIKAIAVRSLVNLAKTITPEEIKAMPASAYVLEAPFLRARTGTE